MESLQELLSEPFAVSVHCPLADAARRLIDAARHLIDAARHLIDAAALSRMPRGGYLINTARGGVVDTAAVADGRLAGAGIDVLPDEPPRPDNPLVAAWRDPSHPAHRRLILNPTPPFTAKKVSRTCVARGPRRVGGR